MPNHETNHVVIIGAVEKISALMGECLYQPAPDQPGQPLTLDFDKILPMPPELRATVSPATVVETQEKADEINNKYALHPFSGDQTIKAITAAEALRRRRDYGAVDWYDWASHNWGTKWNAYSPSLCELIEGEPGGDVMLRLVFETAWSQPSPIFTALAKKYGVTVLAITLDEGGYPPVFYSSNEDIEPGDFMYIDMTVEFRA